jgi:hypothetical protein
MFGAKDSNFRHLTPPPAGASPRAGQRPDPGGRTLPKGREGAKLAVPPPPRRQGYRKWKYPHPSPLPTRGRGTLLRALYGANFADFSWESDAGVSLPLVGRVQGWG